jgi:hypothetical protein
MRQTAAAELRLDESKAGSFSDKAPSIAGSMFFARGNGEVPLPKSFKDAILVPKVARTRRMLARGIDSVPIEECFVHKEVA